MIALPSQKVDYLDNFSRTYVVSLVSLTLSPDLNKAPSTAVTALTNSPSAVVPV